MDSPMIGDAIWGEDLEHNEISLFAQPLEALTTPLIAQEAIRLLQKMRYELLNATIKKERYHWVINE